MLAIVKKLLTVKSIVTLILTGVFAYLAAVGEVGPDLFLTVYAVIISFYFGTQHERGKTTDTAAEPPQEAVEK